MNHIDIIDEHSIIRETVGYEVLNQVPVEDMPKVLEFLKILYNYNRMKKVVEEDKEPGWSDFMAEYLKEETARYKDVPTVVVNRESKEEGKEDLISKILADRSNANGHDKDGNPKYTYDGYEYILNTSCNKILAVSFEKVEPRWSSKWEQFGK